jgi:hypothetical protein
MIESIELLIAQAQKLALSQYTRSAERSKWTRLAGQLIQWKDHILRDMTFEALEHDMHAMMRYVYGQNEQQRRPTWQRIGPTPLVPTLVKKKKVEQDDEENSSDTIPEIMKEDVPDKASSDADPLVPQIAKKKEDREDVTSNDSSPSSENPVG